MKPQTVAVLDALREAGNLGLTPIEALREVGTMRLAARVRELRQAGYPVVSQNLGKGVWVYVLREKAAA